MKPPLPGLRSEATLEQQNESLRQEIAELKSALKNSLTDDTERKQAEDKLIFERNQLETLFRQSPTAMVLWTGPDLVFEKVNPHH